MSTFCQNDTTEQILLYLCILEMFNSKIYK
nr:MAG TPA: hypothetical protein [Caudoviricetes sp.]